MLTIRLIKTGKRNSPKFRIIVIEKKTAPQSGKFLEVLGNYNPVAGADGKKQLILKKDRILYWLSCGAQSSPAVHNLLVNEGVVKGKKIRKKITAKKKKEEAPSQEDQKPSSDKVDIPTEKD